MLEMPNLPFPYFWRVTTLLQSPILELRKYRKFLLSEQINSIWIQESNDEHLVEQAEYLKKLLEESLETELFIQKREGDYPPKKLSDD